MVLTDPLYKGQMTINERQASKDPILTPCFHPLTPRFFTHFKAKALLICTSAITSRINTQTTKQ